MSDRKTDSRRAGTLLVSTLSFVFGVVPATILCIFALVGFLVAVETAFSGVLFENPGRFGFAIFFMTITVMGVIGYVSLWRASLFGVDRKTAAGLAVGLLANVYALFALHDVNPRALNDWYLVYSPAIVAGFHIGRFVSGSRRPPPDSSHMK